MEDNSKEFYKHQKTIYDLFVSEKMDFVIFVGTSTENNIVSDLNAFGTVNKCKIIEINTAQGFMGDSTKTIVGDPFQIVPDLC